MGRAAMLALAALSCRTADDRPPTNVAPMPATPQVPAGWVTVEPTAELLRCANWSKHEWQVSIDHGALAIIDASVREPNTGPTLPFALPKQLRGRRHALAVPDGFLVGVDAGEWGGSLHAFSADGQQHTELADENVRGLVAFGDDVVSIEGLSHLSLSEGNARWLHRDGNAWREVALTPLDAGPQTFAAAADAIYVVTLESLVRIGRDRKATVIQPLRIHGLYPDSMTVDDLGRIWIGMRHFALRLSPAGTRYEETWLVPERCKHARLDPKNFDCICEG
jgi:hypothetical protein